MTIGLVNVNYAITQNAFICIASKATGFAFDSHKKHWKSSDFNVDSEKKIIQKINGTWEWRKFDEKFGTSCKESIKDTLTCVFSKYPLEVFKFNMKSKKYIYSYVAGYFNDDINSFPYIEIGTCTPINFK